MQRTEGGGKFADIEWHIKKLHPNERKKQGKFKSEREQGSLTHATQDFEKRRKGNPQQTYDIRLAGARATANRDARDFDSLRGDVSEGGHFRWLELGRSRFAVEQNNITGQNFSTSIHQNTDRRHCGCIISDL